MNTDKDIEALEHAVRQAVEHGQDVLDSVRRLTLRLLCQSPLDLGALRQIAGAVLRGARAGVAKDLQLSADQSQLTRQKLAAAVSGLDAALAQFAEVAKLALEEAASHAQAYSAEDIECFAADLARLENLLFDTLNGAATDVRDLAGTIYADLTAHLSQQGSAVGVQLQDTLAALARQLSATTGVQAKAGKHLAQATCTLLRQIAAGALEGVAAQIKPAGKTSQTP